MGALYLSQVAVERIEAAQAVIDWHVQLFTGVCRACGEEAPCGPHAEAVAVLGRYGRLPMRRAGAAIADRVTPAWR